MNKKQFAAVAAAVLVMAVFIAAGCSSRSKLPSDKPDQAGDQTGGAISRPPLTAGQMNPDAPDWYRDPPHAAEFIYGIGSAKMENAARSQRVSEQRARASVMNQLNRYFERMIIIYEGSTKTAGGEAAARLVVNMSRALATLTGARIIKRHAGPDGTWYALIRYPKSNAQRSANDAIEGMAQEEPAIQIGAALKAIEAAFAQIMIPEAIEE